MYNQDSGLTFLNVVLLLIIFGASHDTFLFNFLSGFVITRTNNKNTCFSKKNCDNLNC